MWESQNNKILVYVWWDWESQSRMEWIPSSKGLVSGLHKVWGPFLAWNKAAVGLSKEANGNKNLCNSIKLKVWTLKGGQNPKGQAAAQGSKFEWKMKQKSHC